MPTITDLHLRVGLGAMGWRYRRSINAGPLRLNLSKRGVGYSLGIPGCRVSTHVDGRRYLVLSVPGTGISWWKLLQSKKKSGGSNSGSTNVPVPTVRSGRGKPPIAQATPVIQQSPVSSQQKRPRIRFK